MKKCFFATLIILCCFNLGSAQTAGDVLENGIRVKSGEKIFLKFENESLKFDIAKSLQDATNPIDYTLLGDSLIFLVSKNGVNVYLSPLNPLNYSYTTETKVIADPINEATSNALTSIIDVLSTTKKIKEAKTESYIATYDTCSGFISIESNLKDIQTFLKNNQKDAIVKVFNTLKELSFENENSTINELTKIEKAINPVGKYFTKIDSLIEFTKNKIEKYDCEEKGAFITKFIFNSLLKELKITAEEQKKRFENLNTAYDLVKKQQEIASAGGGGVGLQWCLKLDEVPSKEGSVSVYSIYIKESGYQLSDKNEIVSVENKEILKKTLRVRKFQVFIPEVSTGLVYTFFKYNAYGTTSDSTGQNFVASPTNNYIKNINISAMVNWNLFCPNSPIHPLFQVGAGVNAGIPSFLVGGGLRFSNNSKNRIRITGGLAMTWLKELDKLKVGDKISGTSDIDKDMKFDTAPMFSPYVGLQYNF